MSRWLAVLLCVLIGGGALASCGVKSDLQRPAGQAVQDDEPDPSRPPQPLGQ